MIFNRKWAMPNHETFSIKPIGEFVRKHLNGISVAIKKIEWVFHNNNFYKEIRMHSSPA